ncbi:MAG: hypothetical protein KKB13_27595, partial [Chloroflexi bacterium]|nr:hypothetical protein [Chloroflexota bacterium]
MNQHRISRMWTVLIVSATIGLMVACTCLPPTPTAQSKPTATIVAPANGGQVAVGQSTAIQIVATDASGVTRIEVQVDGALVGTAQSQTPQGQPSLIATQDWTFTTTGSHVIMAQAFNAAGQASDVTAITVQAVASVAEQPTATIPPAEQPTATTIPPAEQPTATTIPPAEQPTATIPPGANPPPTAKPPAPTGCPPPTIPSFTASPSTITAGGSTTLSWGLVTNATSVSIDHGVGGVGTPGTKVVSPASTTTYVLTAEGCGGTATKQVTVVVNPPAVKVWSNWEKLGGTFTDTPAVASWSANRLDVFVKGTNFHLMHRWWNGSAWSGWQDLEGEVTTSPGCVSWGPNRIDCFSRNMDIAALLGHIVWDGAKWSAWEKLGGVFTGTPAVASWSANRLDVFVQGTNSHLMHRWWNGSGWSGWEDLGGELTDSPACVSWGPNRID